MQRVKRHGLVVITGATGGVGRVTAAFCTAGCDSSLIARQGAIGRNCPVEQNGGRPYRILADVANADQLEAAAERMERELDPIDVWINNAMKPFSLHSYTLHLQSFNVLQRSPTLERCMEPWRH